MKNSKDRIPFSRINMAQSFVIDTFAWIEYFLGSNAGSKARAYIENGHTITPTIVISELTDRYLREDTSPTEQLRFIRIKSTLVPLDDRIAELAGRLNVERKVKVKGWGLADSIILATARARKIKVLTGDDHFADLKDEVIMIQR